MAEEKKQRYIVRILNTDIDGSKTLVQGLAKIKGVSDMLANAICVVSKMNHKTLINDLTSEQIESLQEIMKNPLKFNIPLWMLNRRVDPETGNDMHLLTSDLDFVKANDIKLMQKIKCYKGVRHYFRLPLRGQRTKSNFRRNKGKASSLKKKR